MQQHKGQPETTYWIKTHQFLTLYWTIIPSALDLLYRKYVKGLIRPEHQLFTLRSPHTFFFCFKLYYLLLHFLFHCPVQSCRLYFWVHKLHNRLWYDQFSQVIRFHSEEVAYTAQCERIQSELDLQVYYLMRGQQEYCRQSSFNFQWR